MSRFQMLMREVNLTISQDDGRLAKRRDLVVQAAHSEER